MVKTGSEEHGFEVIVGGGLGRTPVIGTVIREFLPEKDLLPYLEAILSAYNSLGSRDNKYKARIKITVRECGIDRFRNLVEERFQIVRKEFLGADQELYRSIREAFAEPDYTQAPTEAFDSAYRSDPSFRAFARNNLHPHRNPDYGILSVSLKQHGKTPGDATSDQMRLLADLAESFGHDELRVSHEQNIILPPSAQKGHSGGIQGTRQSGAGNTQYWTGL